MMKLRTKKLLALMMTGAMCTAMLAGCGSSGGSASTAAATTAAGHGSHYKRALL